MAKKQDEMETMELDELEQLQDTGSVAFGVDDEIDLEGEGFQARRIDLLIQDTEIQKKDRGDLAMLTLVGVNEGELPYPIRETFWLCHENKKAEDVGKGNLRRLFKAVFGVPKGSVGGLRGQHVNAWVKEDDSGRLTAGSYRAVEQMTAAEPVLL